MGTRQAGGKVIAITLVILVSVGCSGTASRPPNQETPTAIAQEQPGPPPSTAAHTPEPPTPPPSTATYTPEPPTPTPFEFLSTEPLTERPRYVWLEQQGVYADYLYRQFLQNPQEAAWGPDGYLYVADGSGKHIVRITPDGTMDDLGLWKNHVYMQEYGPNAIEFDQDGNLFFNTGPHLFRLNTDGSIDWIFTAQAGDIRGLTMDDTGNLFYSLNTGPIYRWNPDGKDTFLTDEYHDPQILIGPGGDLYISDYGMNRIVVFNVESREARIFAEGYFGTEAAYQRFDSEGYLWVRGTPFCYRFGPDGEPKPFTVNEMPSDQFSWHLAGDIDFDGSGNLWVTYGNGQVIRLNLVESGGADPEFTSEWIHQTFDASEVAVGPDGAVYATNLVPGNIWRFTPDGSYGIFWDHGDQGRVSIAISDQGVIYAGSIFGEILKMENGTISHYANLNTERLVIGGDGHLYATTNDDSGYKIVRITGVDSVETLASEIAGIPLGDAPVQIAPAMDQGLFVLSESNGTLFRVTFDGTGEILIRLAESLGVSTMASSRAMEKVYVVSHQVYGSDAVVQRYSLYQYEPGGKIELIAPVVPGDPWGMDVSPDGKWLYIVEVGAIDRIPLGEP